MAACLAVAALTVTACGTSSDGDELTVVASTNVWGSVAQAVAGERVEVTSIIDEPSADPHSFEASPLDAAQISDASLLVYNGGGYDQFVDDVLDSAGNDITTVEAYALLEGGAHADEHEGHDHEGHEGHDHGAVNEHVWFDVSTVGAVAQNVADKLAELDPDNADEYRANARGFGEELQQITEITDRIASTHPGVEVAQSEPIAQYLLASAGARDMTPPEFTSAIEEGNDPAPAAIAETRRILTDKQVRVLVYNIQTQDQVTQDMRRTAEAASIPVVEVTETLPEGQDYIQWQTANANALATALGTPA
ncbi:metal ABC transporter solute-binding protein, Zn/Mn family [Rhodococcus sp. NPDC058521]|uniref:metal ABC transporter solute-binding protein, Zn/Mn family n=1 Tax=Rhodococcus sp. NPDC058521 TaxID=3346536 RepID=UPI00364CB104